VSHQGEADRRVVSVIRSSVLFSALHRALATVWRAAEGSAVVHTLSQWAGEWSGLDPSRQRLVIGSMLIMAAVTHVVLTLATLTPPGWFWMVLPGIVAAIGMLLVAWPAPNGAARR
jgi:uncharacterized membrane protein HdeD (DUF308 family)